MQGFNFLHFSPCSHNITEVFRKHANGFAFKPVTFFNAFKPQCYVIRILVLRRRYRQLNILPEMQTNSPNRISKLWKKQPQSSLSQPI